MVDVRDQLVWETDRDLSAQSTTVPLWDAADCDFPARRVGPSGCTPQLTYSTEDQPRELKTLLGPTGPTAAPRDIQTDSGFEDEVANGQVTRGGPRGDRTRNPRIQGPVKAMPDRAER